MTPQLTIVIVNWNGGELLRGCLASVAHGPPTVAYEIVVVDNASSDDSPSWLRSPEAREGLKGVPLRLIENPTNVGFGTANNQAIAAGVAPLVLLLNPDTAVCPGAIDALVATIRSDPRIGGCGPRLLNPDGSLQPSVWPNPPTPWEIAVSGLGVWRLIPRRARGEWLLGRHWDHARRRRVPMLVGAALLVRRAVFEDVGGFDERFHMYAEDDEWCLRARRAGWQLVFEPAARVVHHGGHFARQRWRSGERQRVQLEASYRFQQVCLARPHHLANLATGCLVMALHRGWRGLRRQPSDDVAVSLQMHLTGLRRALRGRR